ncbi:MAG: Xaa-Pro peptidase family protein [Bacillota bacterium]|nr:Xaa-Pro peptidase family protein [Bacillota bacterium]
MHEATMDYLGRCARLRAEAVRAEIDLTVVSPSSDMTYLCGYVHRPSDRPTMLMIPAEGEPFVVAPVLEAMKAETKTGGLFRVVPWAETENPFAVLRREAPARVQRLAVAEQMWAGDLLRLQEQFTGAAVVNAQPLTTALRIRKSPEELAMIREAGRIADIVYARARELDFAGRTEATMADEIIRLTKETGGALGTCILAAGENSASPHHSPGERAIRDGDSVWMDYGGRVADYPSDVTRTVFVGTPPEEYRRVYDVVRRAQETARSAVRPGLPCQEIDRIARKVIIEAGYGGGILHRTGHGLGLDGHEHPYMVEGNGALLEPGMVFSVEPGIYLKGKFGVRIEDIVAVTADGVEVFNHSSHDLFTVK